MSSEEGAASFGKLEPVLNRIGRMEVSFLHQPYEQPLDLPVG